ncbi:MAG TPA: hypothetical protein VNL92_02690 [Dehalococcoidia bacterium]|nr:hypothetical protein [Dehalococcoidia bacterium]
MARLILATRPDVLPLSFSGESSDLVWFLSFAAVEQYGSQHELSKAATVLRHKHKVRLRPLLRFTAHDDDDAEELERAWQDPAPLADVARRIAGLLEGDDRELAAYTKDFPGLADQLRELASLADVAAERGAQIRMTYEL